MTRLEQRGGGAIAFMAAAPWIMLPIAAAIFSRDGPLPNHVTNTPAEPHLAHGESPLIVRAIQKDSVVLKYSSRGTTYGPYRRQFRVRERLPCRTTQ